MKFIEKLRSIFVVELAGELIKAKSANDQAKIYQMMASSRALKTICISFSLLMFFGVNYLLNVLPQLPGILMDQPGASAGILQAFRLRLSYWPFYLFLLAVLAALDMMIVYKLRMSYAELNPEIKGNSRWATLDELKAQYKEIPASGETFPGYGGLPVSWDDNKILIDDLATNALIFGITRSGKGEMFIFPMIDNLSRAEEQASMVILDAKQELLTNSYDTLIKRGYNVHAFNLVDPKNSMGNNALAPIVDSYQAGDQEEAQLICHQYCSSLYNPSEKGDDEFWKNTGSALLSGLIMGLTIDSYELDNKAYEELVQAVADDNAAIQEKKANYQVLGAKEKKKIDNICHALEMKKSGKTVKEIADKLGVTERTVKGYVQKKLEDLPALPPFSCPEKSVPQRIDFRENISKINMPSVLAAFERLVKDKYPDADRTKLDDYFDNRPDDIARRLYLGVEIPAHKTRASIYATMLSKLTPWMYEGIARITSQSTVNLEDIGFGDKPEAIFLCLPDYDTSNYCLASIFISQLYYTLSKRASREPGQRCRRRVVFLLDEVGNVPAIPYLAGGVNVGLSRGLVFVLALQGLTMLKNRYGNEKARTIIDGCGNKVYILSDDDETLKRVQEWIGEETVTMLSRNGDMASMDKSYTESSVEKPLLFRSDLMHPYPGECIVMRMSKRTDLQGNPIRSYPIHATGETKFKYRHEYLYDFITDKVSGALDLAEIDPHLTRKDFIFDISKALSYHAANRLVRTLEEPNFLYSYLRQYSEQLAEDATIQDAIDIIEGDFQSGRMDANIYKNFMGILKEVLNV